MRSILLSLALLSAAHAADFFPMAVWYGGGKARAPMLDRDARAKKELWRKDIRQIKALGFNTVRTWIDWATGEPHEHEYHFDNLDVILELAQEEGLKVFLQVYMDSAPRWVGDKYPDSLFISSNGAAVIPESAPGYCMDHPGVRRAMLAFYSALAQRARRSPAFVGWDLWSEPHIINWANPTYIPNPEFCFCKYTIAKFRAWLEKKYGDIANLNAAWYRQFTSWDQVEPGRMSTILSYSDYIDWKTFIADKLGDDLRDRALAVKTAAPYSIVTSHAAGVGLFSSPDHWEGQPDDWTMARQVDYYGTSFYPKHSAFVDRDPAWRGALFDFARSFGYADGRPGFYIGELQGGFGTVALNVGPTVTPEDLRVWTWSALARGAKGINFYAWYPMSSGYESGGFGLIQLDGTITARARTAGAIASIVDRNQQLFLHARPTPAEVAIIYNPLSHFVGGRQRAASYGGPQGEASGIERDSLLGIYRALFPRSVPLDYVHIKEISPAVLKPYKLVILPYPLLLPESAAPALKAYVQAGGTLVAEARLGWNDERGHASARIPGMGLSEVMGCRETAVQVAAKGRTELRWTASDLPGLAPGALLPARWYEETLEPLSDSARIVARFPDNAPAAVISRYGRGKTLMLGSYLSAAYETAPSPAAARFFAALLQWADVALPVEGAGPGIEVRTLESGPDKLVFAFNHNSQPAEAGFGQKKRIGQNDEFIGFEDGGDENSGTRTKSAWRSLSAVNRRTFQPGDRILLRAGCAWSGQLAPQGSGAPGNPIAIDLYGLGTRPRIEGDGVDAAILLDDQEYWEISNVAVTDDAPVEGFRRGVLIRGGKTGRVLHHIYLQNLNIQHVKGNPGEDLASTNTGAIGFEIHGTAVPARFDDIAVEHCYIASVDQTGIYTWSESSPHPRDPHWEQLRFTNVRIQNNRLRDLGRNAIVIRASLAPLIEGNIVERGAQTLHGNAIAVSGCKDAVIQLNEVSATRFDRIEGAAFASGENSEGTLIQYNYSHDNGGGLVDLRSNPESQASPGYNDGTVLRYNISQNDAQRIFGFDGPVTNTVIYNNTVYIGKLLSPRIIDFNPVANASAYAGHTRFLNNIIYNLGNGTYAWGKSTGNLVQANCFFGSHPAGEPTDPDKVVADPLFVAPGTGGSGRNSVDGYKLKAGSPCIDSGVELPGHGGRDYLGNKLYTRAPDRGAFEQPSEAVPK